MDETNDETTAIDASSSGGGAVACDCIDRVNEALLNDEKGGNTRVGVRIYLNGKRPRAALVSVKADKGGRKKTVDLTASFCPFCGQDYDLLPVTEPRIAPPASVPTERTSAGQQGEGGASSCA